MFWGLEMEPAKVYKQKVEKSFHVSMACLQPNKCTDASYTSLIIRKDNNDFVLCNLQKDKAIQVQLDLMFGSGDEIAFTLKGGKNKIYLSGYILEDEDPDQLFEESESEMGDATEEEIPTLVEGKRKPDPSPFESKTKKAKLKIDQSDEDSDESDESEEDNEKGGDEEDSDEEDSEGDEDDVSEEEGESGSESDDELDSGEENTPVKLATAKTPEKSKNKSPAAIKQQNTPVTTPNSQVNGKTPKSKKKNKVNTPDGDTITVTPKSQKTPETPKQTTPQKTKLEGGVVAIDTKVGSGAYAKAGKRVAVYYTGRLQQNNKQFDSSTQGKGFVFQLGRGEVIKGWDIGVAGMKVGGKRKIVVPAPLAYGSKGSPPVIPPNANLVFEIELKNVY